LGGRSGFFSRLGDTSSKRKCTTKLISECRLEDGPYRYELLMKTQKQTHSIAAPSDRKITKRSQMIERNQGISKCKGQKTGARGARSTLTAASRQLLAAIATAAPRFSISLRLHSRCASAASRSPAEKRGRGQKESQKQTHRETSSSSVLRLCEGPSIAADLERENAKNKPTDGNPDVRSCENSAR
jgi:hypothetical protein